VNRAPLRSAEGRCGAGTAPRLGYLGHGRGSATTPGQPLSHGKLHGGTRCSWGKEGRTRRVRGAAEFWARVLWGSSSTDWGVGCPQPCVPAASAACGSAVQAGLERVSGSSSPDGRPSTAAMLGAFPGSGRLARAASGGVRAKAAWLTGVSGVCVEAQGERRWGEIWGDRVSLALWQEVPVPLAGQDEGCRCRPSARLRGQKARRGRWLPVPRCGGSAGAFAATQLPGDAGALSSEVFRLGWTWPGPAWPGVGDSPAWSPFPPAPRRCCEGNPGLVSHHRCIPARSGQHLPHPYGGPSLE